MMQIDNSKNIIAAHIDANGNVIVGDGNNITVINLKEAAQYKLLQVEIEELNTLFAQTKQRIEQYPNDISFQEELIKIDGKRSQKQKEIETLQQEVIKLADDFQRIPINTERLHLAKQHFESGEFAAARAVLNAETMGKELEGLLQNKEYLQERTEENQQQLSNTSNEYLILAGLTTTDFTLPDRFEKTLSYFEQSLKAERNAENLFSYAYFLNEHNQFAQAKPLYEEAVQMYKQLAEVNPQTYLLYIVTTLNNLALLNVKINELVQAQFLYEEALQIHRQLAEVHFQAYLPFLAGTLNNLANLHADRNDFNRAQPLYEEALQIYRQLDKENPQTYLLDVAGALNNLALLRMVGNEFIQAQLLYEEALQIRRQFTGESSQTYLSDLAMTLSNLAIFYIGRNELSQVQTLSEEALQIYRQLAEVNPRTYLPRVANTLEVYADFFRASKDYIQALKLYQESLTILSQFAKREPSAWELNIARLKAKCQILAQSLKDTEKENVQDRSNKDQF